jgi:hypothetical protein
MVEQSLFALLTLKKAEAITEYRNKALPGAELCFRPPPQCVSHLIAFVSHLIEMLPGCCHV